MCSTGWSSHPCVFTCSVLLIGLNYSLQFTSWSWGRIVRSLRDGPGLCHSWKTHQKTFAAIWRLWESWDAPCESDDPPRTPSAPSERPQSTGEDDKPAAVPTKSPAQVFVETPLCMAFSRACRRSQVEFACKCVCRTLYRKALTLVRSQAHALWFI